MKREILNLKEYDLIPLIDESWKDRDEYHEINEDGDFLQDEFGNYVTKSGEWDNFKLINSELKDYDLEYGYSVDTNIIQRISDNKYFSFESTWSPYNGYIIKHNIIVEVFPKEITKIIYE